MVKKWWRPESGIFLAFWLLLMIGGRSRFFNDPGTFWHTVVGEQMLSSGRPIRADTFTFTFAGRPWVAYEWLGECLMAGVHRLDRFDSLLVATVTLLAGLYTWVAHRLIRAGLHWSLAVTLTGLAMAASSCHFHIRPHIGTMLFLGCTFAWLCDFESGRIGMRRLFWLVPLFVVWTNVHGGMLGGLGTIGLTFGGWGLARILGKATPVARYRQMVPLGVLLLMCGLAALINPYFLDMPRTWLTIMDSPILPHIIQEHAPLNFARTEGWMVLGLGLVYSFILLGTLPRWPRVTWLLPLVWFALACTRVRHAPLFAITAGVALADMLPHTCWAAWLVRKGSDWFRFPGDASASARPTLAWRALLLPAGVVVSALALQAGRVPVPVLGHGWARLDAVEWPTALLPELERAQHDQPGGATIFNEYAYGGFLIYHTPGFRVFVDDRCELFGDRWLDEFVRAEWQDTARHVQEWDRIYRSPGQAGAFDFALTATGSGFDHYFHTAADWTELKRTPTATLYRRKGSWVRIPILTTGVSGSES